MSKLQKPDFIVFIGASLYKDLIKRAHLERTYPYITDAIHVNKFPTYSDDIIDDTIKIIKYKKFPTAIFVLDKFYTKVIQKIKEYGFEAVDKGKNSKTFAVNGTILILKSIDIFSNLPAPTKIISNKSIGNFKAFGDEKSLEELEDKLCTHASIMKVTPTWYNIEILDSNGENILIKSAKELNIKLLPIKSIRVAIIEYFSKIHKKISCAESCTGGLLASKFISVSGSSKVIDGCMVTYSNKIKMEWLDVKEDTLNKYGAVSKEVVEEMLEGIEQKTNSDISIAISGIAGPTGGTKAKPVGTVFIGLKNGSHKEVKRFQFNGDRGFIQEEAVRNALEMLICSEPGFFEFFAKK